MSEKLNFGKTCLIALAALTVSGIALDAAAQAVPVSYAANENQKTIQIPRGPTGALPGNFDIGLRSAPIARVCNVRSAELVRAFVAANPLRLTAIVSLRALRNLDPLLSDNLDNKNVLAFVPSLNGILTFVTTDAESRAVSFNPVPIASGQNVTVTVYSNCLTMPSFRLWKNEFIRVLDLYYGLVAPY